MLNQGGLDPQGLRYAAAGGQYQHATQQNFQAVGASSSAAEQYANMRGLATLLNSACYCACVHVVSSRARLLLMLLFGPVVLYHAGGLQQGLQGLGATGRWAVIVLFNSVVF